MSLVFTPARGDNHSPVIYMKAHANHNLFDVSLETFDTLVLAASGNRPVLVDFWAEWCSPCIALEAVLHRVIEEFAGKIGLARIEVDEGENMKLAGRYHVRGFPTIILFEKSTDRGRFSGAKTAHFIETFIEQHSRMLNPKP